MDNIKEMKIALLQIGDPIECLYININGHLSENTVFIHEIHDDYIIAGTEDKDKNNYINVFNQHILLYDTGNLLFMFKYYRDENTSNIKFKSIEWKN